MVRTAAEIPKWASDFLTVADCDQIEAAVHDAEKTTSGEIVPMLVHSSVNLKVPRQIIFLVLVLAIIAGLGFFSAHIDFYSWQGICFELLLGAIAAVLAFFMPIPPALIRLVMPNSDLQLLVEKQAELEFYRLGINGTERQSGVLLFVSLTEHRAVVLADKAIAVKFPANTWSDVLSTLLAGLSRGKAASGFVDAIHKTAEILAPHFPYHADDKDELSNRLVIK